MSLRAATSATSRRMSPERATPRAVGWVWYLPKPE